MRQQRTAEASSALQQLRTAAPGDLEVTFQVGAAHASSARIHALIPAAAIAMV